MDPQAPTTRIAIYCDGACRNNGTAHAKASAAAFVFTYDSKYSFATTLPGITSNNVAEISACVIAMETAISIFHDTQHLRFTIIGDSNHVVSALTSGFAHAYGMSPMYQNSPHWALLSNTLQKANLLGIYFEFSWTPRLNNKEADELCNAVLDDRPPNFDIHSQIIELPSFEDIKNLLTLLTQRRLPTLRRIPRDLEAPWAQTVARILEQQVSSEMRRFMFLLLPHLLSLETLHISGRTTFKILRAHINMLSNPNYLASSIFELRARLRQEPTPFTPQEETEERER